jgi:hypothetical protein
LNNAKSSNELAQDRIYHCTYRKYPLILASNSQYDLTH